MSDHVNTIDQIQGQIFYFVRNELTQNVYKSFWNVLNGNVYYSSDFNFELIM